MTVEATYPDGTYQFVGNTFPMLALVRSIQSTDKDCPLKEFDLLTGHISAIDYGAVKKALESFEMNDEKADQCRAGLISALDVAINEGHDFVIFT